MSSTGAAPVKAMPGYNWKHMPLASAVMYSVISIAITLINKAVLSSYCAFAAAARRPRNPLSLGRLTLFAPLPRPSLAAAQPSPAP